MLMNLKKSRKIFSIINVIYFSHIIYIINFFFSDSPRIHLPICAKYFFIFDLTYGCLLWPLKYGNIRKLPRSFFWLPCQVSRVCVVTKYICPPTLDSTGKVRVDNGLSQTEKLKYLRKSYFK